MLRKTKPRMLLTMFCTVRDLIPDAMCFALSEATPLPAPLAGAPGWTRARAASAV